MEWNLIPNVLVLENHGELFRLSRFFGFKLFSDFERLLKQNSYTLKNFKKGILLSPDLTNVQVLILGAPHAEIMPEEIQAIRDFVSDGGGLLLIGNANIGAYYRSKGLSAQAGGETGLLSRFHINFPSLNSLAAIFGITFHDEYIVNGAKFLKSFGQNYPIITNFSSHPVLVGVQELIIGTGAPLSLQGKAQAIAITDSDTTPPSCAVLAATSFAKGRVIALSSFTPFTRLSLLKIPVPYGLYKPDHTILALNIVNWLATPS
jgi:uncharacterized membrane protein